MFDIITVGDVVIDNHLQIDNASLECDVDKSNCRLCFDYATKIPITDSTQSLGGNAANVVVGLATLDLKSTIITSVGDDANGKTAIEELQNKNVNTDYCFIEKNNLTRYAVILNYQGERTILSHHRKRKYVWPAKMPASNWIYYTGMSEGFEDVQNKIYQFAKKHGTVRVVFNPGSYQIKKAIDLVRDAIKNTDILIINLEEAEKILGTTLKKEKSEAGLIHELLNLGVKEVVITDGERGAWTGDIENIYHMNTFPVEVISKTGAGDAFSSGYTAARVRGHEMKQALVWGIANSSATITSPGAQNGLLNRDGVDKMLEKYKKIQPERVI